MYCQQFIAINRKKLVFFSVLIYHGRMETVLILGNGISRLAFDEQIRSFSGEAWACNRAYLDFGDKITALAGHIDVMQEARDYRDANGQKYRVFGIDEDFTCSDLFRKDTGTTLVAEALTRGYNVIVCGFDLGGLDVYSPGHEKKNKSSWVQRWRLIFKEFDPDRVSFWGYDHKPFIQSNRPVVEYFRDYSRGRAHLKDGSYQEIVKGWKCDYSRIWEKIPRVIFRNIGRRDWTFTEFELLGGAEKEIPESLARKYLGLYPREFEILPLPK